MWKETSTMPPRVVVLLSSHTMEGDTAGLHYNHNPTKEDEDHRRGSYWCYVEACSA